MGDIERRKAVNSFNKMLQERLSRLTSLRPENPRFQYFLEYDMRAVERGQMAVASVQTARTKVQAASLLDIGCGTGGFAVAFALAGAQVVALDTDKGALQLAALRAENERVHVNLIDCDGTHTPFQDSSFEIIVCNEVFEHVESKEKLASEIARLLRENGIVYVRVPNKASPWNILWDDHTGLPFFTLLPRFVQDFLVKVTGLSPTGMPCALDEPTYGSLKRIFNDVGMELDDGAMRENVSNAVFLLETDLLRRARSNRYSLLAKTSLKLLRIAHDISKRIRLSHLWWFLVLRTYPILTFIGTKSVQTASA